MLKLPLRMFKIRLFCKAVLPVPTLTGTVLLLCLFLITSATTFRFIHPFLAVNKPLSNSVLIVEGWLPDYCIDTCAEIYRKNKAQSIIVTGGPLEQGSYLKEYKTYAALGAATLHVQSVPDSDLYIVPAEYSPVDRTYASAVALKHWIDSTSFAYRKFTLCSQSTHTRRSVLFFKRALGNDYTVGSHAIDDRDYNAETWWMSSKGVRSVIDETIAYMYGLFFVTFKTSGATK